MDFFKWLFARLWKNFGVVTSGLYRSGQMGPIRLLITYLFVYPDIVIALNIEKNPPWKERFEEWVFKRLDAEWYKYNWGSSGPSENCEEEKKVIGLINESLDNGYKCYVHCAGGKDRTGGIIGYWYYDKGHDDLDFYIDQCIIHKTPWKGWTEFVVGRYYKNRRSVS